MAVKRLWIYASAGACPPFVKYGEQPYSLVSLLLGLSFIVSDKNGPIDFSLLVWILRSVPVEEERSAPVLLKNVRSPLEQCTAILFNHG